MRCRKIIGETIVKKLLIALIAGGILGTAFGFAVGIFVYPFWFLNDVAMETVASPQTKTKIASGVFVPANPSDPIHYGKGSLSIFVDKSGERLLHPGDDFEVGPGPAFHVYLVDSAKVRSNADFRESKMTDLGRLKAFRGSQNYAIPVSTDLAGAGSVVIWCKEFSVLISPATLEKT
jgi:hypothetical protein